MIRLINPKFEYRNPKQYQNSNVQNSKQKPQTVCCCRFCFGHLDFGHLNLFRISDFVLRIYSYPSADKPQPKSGNLPYWGLQDYISSPPISQQFKKFFFEKSKKKFFRAAKSGCPLLTDWVRRNVSQSSPKKVKINLISNLFSSTSYVPRIAHTKCNI
jgi:hypothetical protein